VSLFPDTALLNEGLLQVGVLIVYHYRSGN